MRIDEPYLLDEHAIDGTFQIVNVNENKTWGRFERNEKAQLEITVEELNRLNIFKEYYRMRKKQFKRDALFFMNMIEKFKEHGYLDDETIEKVFNECIGGR